MPQIQIKTITVSVIVLRSQDLLLNPVSSMDIALREHQRQLWSSFSLGFLLKFLEKVSDDKGLFVCAIVCHTSHRDGNLFGTTESLWSVPVQLHENEVIIDFQNLLKVIRLELWSKLWSKQHSSLLSGLIHREKTFNLVRLIDSWECLFGMEWDIKILISYRVSDWHKNLLSLFLNDFVPYERGSLNLVCL